MWAVALLRGHAVRQEHATAVNWLREALKEWAAWDAGVADAESPGHGWPGVTPIWQLKHATGHAPMASRIPHGVQPPPSLAKIVSGMIVLGGDPILAYPVNVMRQVYRKGVEAAAVEFGISPATVAVLRNQGEMALRGYLRA